MRVNGVDLFVRDAGGRDRPAVVLLHAFPLSHEMWTPQFPALEARHRVAAFDFRGHGRSGAGDGQYTLDLFADDLFAVLDGLGIRRAALVGLSMGGYVALRAMEREPGRFRALVLADTRSAADGNEGRLKRAAAMRRVKADGAAAFADGFLPTALSPSTIRDRPEVAARVRGMIEACTPLGIAGTLLALAARTDATESLGKIRVPTLVLAGEEDAITPPADARALAGAIPGARLAVLPGAGHLSNLESPDAFNAALLPFLEGLPAA